MDYGAWFRLESSGVIVQRFVFGDLVVWFMVFGVWCMVYDVSCMMYDV